MDYRMYCLVLRQLSPIQKGIQAAHSVVEYGNKYGDTTEYIAWSTVSKTIIMLDGGVLTDLEEIMPHLDERNIKYSVFREEDLGDIVTCISILVDERVFDDETYPDFSTWRSRKYPTIPIYTSLTVFTDGHDAADYTWPAHHDEWIKTVVGNANTEYLRELLHSKRLAQ